MEEILKSLGDQSPMLALFIAFGVWTMRTVIQPLAARQMQFMDTLEIRDREKTESLGSIGNNLVELRKRQDEHLEICRSGTHPSPIHHSA